MFESFSMVAGGEIGWYILLVWTLIWKGFALWRAANKQQKYWFIAMLVLNTAGIVEIVYLFVFSKWTNTNKHEILNTKSEERDPKDNNAKEGHLVENIISIQGASESEKKKKHTSKKGVSSQEKTSKK
jgi:hypothetical protein